MITIVRTLTDTCGFIFITINNSYLSFTQANQKTGLIWFYKFTIKLQLDIPILRSQFKKTVGKHESCSSVLLWNQELSSRR